MYVLDQKKFNTTIIGALMVLIGVILKNSTEQIKLDAPFLKKIVGKMMGMPMFVIGWMIVAYAFSLDKSNSFNFNFRTIMILMSASAIVSSVIVMKTSMENKKPFSPVWPFLFTFGWLNLGFFIMLNKGIQIKSFGVLASLLVLGSMMLLLPLQRKMCVIDGPGMPMFVIAWIILAFFHSLQ